jgi:phospho-N-acetylmuramoyl-pentapeptide-transferase
MINVIQVIGPTVLTFFIGILITPVFTHYFYKYKMWKKTPRIHADTSDTFNSIHNTEHEISTPRVGGTIIWMAVILGVFIIYISSQIFFADWIEKLNFFSRSQTVVPLAAFIFAAIVGLLDDLLQVMGQGTYAKDHLIYRKVKIVVVTLIGFAISLWFYYKLDMATIHIPFGGELFLGLWFIPVFVLVMLATFSTSVIDGLDGLSGGVFASVFTAYALIAFAHNQMDISALCGAIAGATLAFLWFNVPPARFYMGETGSLSLTVVLSVVAFLTDSVLFLPIIALPLVLTSLSVIIQMGSYKYFNKRRVFRVSPLHHHFQAIGWPREKVVMRYWIVSVVCAFMGVILAILG